MNKSGLPFSTGMNTTDNYEAHHYSSVDFDDIYEEEPPAASQPVFNDMDTRTSMCPYN